MNPDILILAGILVATVVLFATEVISIDLVGILVLLALFFTGILDESDALAGFGNPVVVFLGSLFVVTTALGRSGILIRVERFLGRAARQSQRRAGVILLPGIGAVSAFLSNTAAVTAFLPIALGLARKLKIPASRLLMPIAYASILGGTCTLIGTSTNVIISGLLPSYGQPRLGFFELAPVGVPILVLGLLYLLFVAPRLLPDRGEEPLEAYGVRSYISEVSVPPDSGWTGKTIHDTIEGSGIDLRVLGHVKDGKNLWRYPFDRPFEEGDVLLVEADQATLLELKSSHDLDLVGDVRWEEDAEGIQVHEILLAPHSALSGRSLREHDFRNRYELTVLALYRRGEPRRARLGRIRLQDGDVLLVQGDMSRMRWLLERGDVIVLDQTEVSKPPDRGYLTGLIFLAMILAGSTSLLPFAFAALAAATLLVALKQLPLHEAYAAVDWRLLIMIGSLLGLAKAMDDTGAAEQAAKAVVAVCSGVHPVVVLGAFYLLTLVLTQPMSNQAAALVVIPLAIQTAVQLQLNPRAFAITVCVAASNSFLTPLEPASLIVYAPGRYRFRDFFKVGLPLTALAMAVTLILVPRWWPLR